MQPLNLLMFQPTSRPLLASLQCTGQKILDTNSPLRDVADMASARVWVGFACDEHAFKNETIQNWDSPGKKFAAVIFALAVTPNSRLLDSVLHPQPRCRKPHTARDTRFLSHHNTFSGAAAATAAGIHPFSTTATWPSRPRITAQTNPRITTETTTTATPIDTEAAAVAATPTTSMAMCTLATKKTAT